MTQSNIRWRIFVVTIVFGCGAWLLGTGRDLTTVLLILAGVGLTAACIARWVVDGAPLPALTSLLTAERTR